MRNSNITKYLLLATLLISILGVVICFPLKLKSGDTCLLHLILQSGNEAVMSDISNNEEAMLHRYLMPFAFIWWFSLGGMFASIYLLKKKSKGKE